MYLLPFDWNVICIFAMYFLLTETFINGMLGQIPSKSSHNSASIPAVVDYRRQILLTTPDWHHAICRARRKRFGSLDTTSPAKDVGKWGPAKMQDSKCVHMLIIYSAITLTYTVYNKLQCLYMYRHILHIMTYTVYVPTCMYICILHHICASIPEHVVYIVYHVFWAKRRIYMCSCIQTQYELEMLFTYIYIHVQCWGASSCKSFKDLLQKKNYNSISEPVNLTGEGALYANPRHPRAPIVSLNFIYRDARAPGRDTYIDAGLVPQIANKNSVETS